MLTVFIVLLENVICFGSLSNPNPNPSQKFEFTSSTCVATLLLSIISPSGTVSWDSHQLSTLTSTILKSSPITSSLLDMLYDPVNVQHDIVARTTCVSLMKTLHRIRPNQFESDLIATPSGLNRLVDLLSHDSEICFESVRNEIVLLMIDLTRSSEVTRKLVAFNEGFDRLFSIIDHEGGVTGGSIVVSDCLTLANNLVLDDGAMLMLQSASTLTQLPKLLDVRRGEEFLSNGGEINGLIDDEDDAHIKRLLGGDDGTDDANGTEHERARPKLTEAEINIMLLAISLIEKSICEGNGDQNAMHSRQTSLTSNKPLLKAVIDIALHFDESNRDGLLVPEKIQNAALLLLANICDNAPDSVRDEVANSRVTDNTTVIDRLLEIAAFTNFPSLHLTPLIIENVIISVRTILTPNTSSTLILHALAPPPPMDDDADGIVLSKEPVTKVLIDKLR